MDYKEIQELLRLVNKTDLTEVEIELQDFKIKIRRKAPENQIIYTHAQMATYAPPAPAMPAAPAAAPALPAAASAAPSAANDDHLYTFRSPMIGTFYRSSNPETPPFVQVGDTVQKGQVLCIVEAMKLFNEIESDMDGKIVKILVENKQAVEYDQPLFVIERNS